MTPPLKVASQLRKCGLCIKTEDLIYQEYLLCIWRARKHLEVVYMKPRGSDTVCPNPKCGKAFEEPLLLRNLSKSPTERYYVCPHCINKLDSLPLKDEEKSSPVPIVPPQRLEKPDSPSGSPSCTHSFGYLKSLEKNASIPDDCLTCPKLLACMFKK